MRKFEGGFFSRMRYVTMCLAVITTSIYFQILGCDEEVSRIDLVDPTSDHYSKNKAKMKQLREEEKERLRVEARKKNTKRSA